MKCWENFRKFPKDFIIKMRKMHYFSIFFKICNEPLLYFFARLDEKQNLSENFKKSFENLWWKFTRKIEFCNFYFYFGKFVIKNRAFGNNTIFLQLCLRFLWGDFHPSPWLRPWHLMCSYSNRAQFIIINIISHCRLSKLINALTAKALKYTVYL